MPISFEICILCALPAKGIILLKILYFKSNWYRANRAFACILCTFFLFPAKGRNVLLNRDTPLSQSQTTSVPSNQKGEKKESAKNSPGEAGNKIKRRFHHLILAEKLTKALEQQLSIQGISIKKGISTKGERVYHLSIDYKTVNFTGVKRQAMAINNSLPAPTLYFKEGETAVIHVTNKMDVETSIHWHGILLPNFQDGVPYLTTPPIKPGKSHTFTFPLKHSGTYWYHSHTGLQEQRGLYGAIVIEPKKRKWNYDHDLTLVLSDWTDENPREVLRTLKRGSEWYSIKKQTTQSLYKVIKNGALGAQLQLWRQRMPGMDISDVYYPTFLINGQRAQSYPQFKEGEKIRLRVINAGASTYFWLSFGEKALLISADGLNVKPVPTKKILHAIGETYDFLLTLPKGKSIEFRATAQDGSGTATALIGAGERLKAPIPPKPDLMKEMKMMAESHGTSGHGTAHPSPAKDKSMRHLNSMRTLENKKPARHQNSTKQEKSLHHHSQTNLNQKKIHKGDRPAHHHQNSAKKSVHHHNQAILNQKENRKHNKSAHHQNLTKQQKSTHHHSPINQKSAHKSKTRHKPTEDQAGYNDLRSVKKTKFSKNLPVRTIHLNLTGSMLRYVWSMNGKTLSQSDKIKINQNEVVRLVLHNTTMMHHPMHLHGHFFRVLNQQGDHAPLKHTVDVPPMETVTLEFAPDEKGDWFFHCHVLYHMKGGMARVFSRGKERDSRLKDYPLSKVWNTDRQWYLWGEATLMTNRLDAHIETSNIKNRFYFTKTLSWFDHRYKFYGNYEMETGYEYFFTDFFRVYGGLEAQNAKEGDYGRINDVDWTGKAGIRYLLPYLVELDMSLDHKLRWEVELEYELLLLSRWEFFADLEWTEYFRAKDRKIKKRKWEWSLGLSYIMSKAFSLRGSYDNHFGWGVGINGKF